MSHTPAPWFAEGSYIKSNQRYAKGHPNGDKLITVAEVSFFGREAYDNAKFIIEACNCHYELKAINKELIEALSLAIDAMQYAIDENEKSYDKDEGEPGFMVHCRMEIERAKKVIQKAEGK